MGSLYEIFPVIYFMSYENELDWFGQKQLHFEYNVTGLTMQSWFMSYKFYLDRGGSKYFWERVC